MNLPNILCFDTEHGGFVPNSTLLSAYFAVFDENTDQIVEELDLYIKPDDGAYIVTAEAMAVNKINLIEHDKIAVTYAEASKLLRSFLVRNSDDGKLRLDPLGHNVAGDISIVVDRLFGGRNAVWTRYVSYRQLDTGTISRFLLRKGVLPKDQKAGLGNLAEYLKVAGNADHTSKGDTIATYQVYKAMLKL